MRSYHLKLIIQKAISLYLNIIKIYGRSLKLEKIKCDFLTDLQSIALELWRLRLEEKEREAEEKAILEAAAEEEKLLQKQLELTEAQNPMQPIPDPVAAVPAASAEPTPEEGAVAEGQVEGDDAEGRDEEEEEVEEPVRDEEGMQSVFK